MKFIVLIDSENKKVVYNVDSIDKLEECGSGTLVIYHVAHIAYRGVVKEKIDEILEMLKG